METQRIGAPVISLTSLEGGKGLIVDWGVGDGTVEEFITTVERVLLITAGEMILLCPETPNEPDWALAILIEMALLTDSSESGPHSDIGVWDEDRGGFVIITNWGDGHLERGTLVSAPAEQEGPCIYCGQVTTMTIDSPSWSYVDTEPIEEWFCGSPECQAARAADPDADWSEYWACL